MAKHIVLIDGNSIAHANNNATKLTVGGMEVQAIFGFLKSIRALRERLTGDVELYVLWDGRAQFRFDIFPGYKGNRTAMTPDDEAKKLAFRKQTPFIEKAVESLGIKQFRHPHREADDLAGDFKKALKTTIPGVKITLLTGDQDWLQFVDEDTTWFDPIRDRKVDTSNFLEFTGYYSTSAFVQGKALVGDGSDCVPGIENMGDKTAALFLARWKSVATFFKAVDSGAYTPAVRKDKKAKSLHPEQLLAAPEGRALFVRNIKLMSLAHAPPMTKEDLVVVAKPAKPENFIRICERLAFASILRERHAFLDTFDLKLPPEAPAAPPAPVSAIPSAPVASAAYTAVASGVELEDVPF